MRAMGIVGTLTQILYWYQVLGFFSPGSNYWNVAFGGDKGEVKSDDEGLATAGELGRNIAFLVKKLKAC